MGRVWAAERLLLPVWMFVPVLALLESAPVQARSFVVDVPARLVPPDFRVPPTADEERRCLTTAIYYESAHEPLAGQMAVAQVILNRTRHPDYPRTICGVVWQGHLRPTGCQFSFTCDGSLARRPVAALWQNAAAVAERAMGAVGAGDGSLESTVVAPMLNYHATYVRPAWRLALTEAARIGNHIFYARKPNRKAIILRAQPGIADSGPPRPISVWGIKLADVVQDRNGNALQ